MKGKQHVRQFLCIAGLGAALCGCGGGGDSQAGGDSVQEQLLSGSVGDGPVANANLSVYTSSGDILLNAVSDQLAGYNIRVKAKGNAYPLLIEGKGGTDLVTGAAPDFTLFAASLTPSRRDVVNLNPFSTIAVATAREMPGGFTSENISTAVTAVLTVFNSGLSSLSVAGPMNSRIDSSNAAEIVRAAETLAEIFRRTNGTVVASGRSDSTVDDVIDKIGADLIDGQLDGAGSANSDPYVSAVTILNAAEVLVEAMTNQLMVHDELATAALDAAISQISQGAGAPTASLPITDGMIADAIRGVAAAEAIGPSAELSSLLSGLRKLTPGMLPTQVEATLGAGATSALDAVLTQLTPSSTSSIEAVTTSTGAVPAPGTADDPAEPVPDPSTPPADEPTEPVPDPGTPPADDPTEPVPDPGTPPADDPTEPVPEPVTPPADNPPVISGTPPAAVLENTEYRFTPSASDPDGDVLTFAIANAPAWATFATATGTLSGTPASGDVGTYSDIRISVTDGTLTTMLAPFSIEVQAAALGSVTLSWTAPTDRTDGSPLSNLAGYKIYWGTSATALTNTISITNAGLTRYVVDKLPSGNTYYFETTAIDSKGMESPRSNTVSKLIP